MFALKGENSMEKAERDGVGTDMAWGIKESMKFVEEECCTLFLFR